MTSRRRRDRIGALWPWPGTIFLALLSGWLVYMGRIATVADVKSAFYGLGIVSALTMLLGLRVALVRRDPRAREEAAARSLLASRRSRRPEAVAEPVLSPREVVEPRSELPVRSNVTPMYKVETAGPDDAGEAILELEAALNRERADRGAQIVKLEHQIAALSARLERVGGGDGGDAGALENRILALEAKARDRVERQEFASLVARLVLIETRSATEAPDLSGFMRVQAFNSAVGERLIPRMHQMIANALKEHGGAGSAATDDGSAAAATADAAREERAALEAEIRRVREIATKAFKVARTRPPTEGTVAEEVAALKASHEIDRREIAELKAALAARGDVPDTAGGGVKRRIAALEAQLERFAGAETALTDVREALSALGARAARAEESAREALRRIDALANGGGPDAPETPADVATLRDALTTIIEQNRELKAQQERLTARFEPRPVDAEG